MSDYARGSLTEFVSRGHVQRGYNRIRRNYAPRFAQGAQRDSLRFEEFAVRRLAPAVALVTARYVLERPIHPDHGATCGWLEDPARSHIQ